ncbi:MAG: hypothetical protein V3573_02960 [Desulfovibrionaceae bacterium]
MSENKKWIFICDESGAKGFSDKPAEEEPIGVVAGFLLKDEEFSKLEKDVQSIREKYETDEGKLHITDLSKEDQEGIRGDVFELIKQSSGHVVYEAITQDGFHEWYRVEKKFWDNLKAGKKATGYGYTFDDHKKRLQTMLSLGCVMRTTAFLADYYVGIYEFSIQMLTDMIDEKILDEIDSEVANFLNFSPHRKHEVTASRFDYKNKKVEKASGTIEFDIKDTNGTFAPMTDVAFSIEIDTTYDIIADILSNSIRYYLLESFKKNNGIVLTSDKAISNHPLKNKMVSLTPEGGYDFMQSLYSFPVGEEEIDSGDMRMPEDFAENIKFTPDEE